MPYLNANELEDESILDYDVCIIGSGPAGIAIAHEFNRSDTSILILEAGGIELEREVNIL